MATSKPYIGGQAVLEGVMMRAPRCLTVAVRRPDGTIAVRVGPFRSRFAAAVWKWLGLRGIATLIESVTMGFGALQFSAEQQIPEEEREGAKGASKLAIAASVVFALVLFIALPQLLAVGSGKLFGVDFTLQDYRFHLVIGAFKMLILLAYLVAISRVPDIRRVFQYHGAEHKTINAYEKGLALTVDHVRAQTTLHPRCGTTFLVMVVIVAIVAGAIATPLLLPSAHGLVGNLLTLALRIALLPLVAAVSFELQRFTARYCTRGVLRIFLWPGFLVQKITTREPDGEQIEIAIAAMQAAEWRDGESSRVASDDEPLVFPSFASFAEALPELSPAPVAAAAE